jgi:hypothetical protein
MLSPLHKAKLIKGLNRFSQPEKQSEHVVLKQKTLSKLDRKLPGEDGELNEELKTKKVKGIDFKNTIFFTLLREIPKNIQQDSMRMTGDNDGAEWSYKGVSVCSMSLNLEEGDEFHEDFVEVFIENAIINFKLTIEKTRFKDYVEEYLMFYVNKALFMIGQTVNHIEDVKADWKNSLDYVLDKYGGEVTLVMTKYKGKDIDPFDKGGEKERLLKDDEDIPKELMDKKLKLKPILGKFFMKDLDLKNKKYISQKPGVAAYLDTLKPLFEKKKKEQTKPERQLRMTEEELHEILSKKRTLDPRDPRFQAPKKSSFFSGILNHPIFQDFLKLAINISRPVKETGHILIFDLYTGRPNLTDCRIMLEFLDAMNPVDIKFTSPSIDLTMKVAVASKRYIVKGTRLGLEVYAAYLKIIDHLTDLRVWRDKYSDTNKFHYQIYEEMKARILQMMFREVFDNLTDGQTAMPGADQDGVLKMDPIVDSDESSHLFTFSKEGKNVLTIRIRNGELGPEFETMELAGLLHTTQTHGMLLGDRIVPMKSMYNQHFMLKRFIDFIVELIVRSDPFFIDYKDNITPFITDAYQYSYEFHIPPLIKPTPSEPIVGLKYSTDVLNSNKLEPKYFGDRIVYKLCPVLSTEYHDTIKEIEGMYVYAGARFFLRRDIDYCYAVVNLMLAGKGQKQADGEEERRLLEDNVSGHLV